MLNAGAMKRSDNLYNRGKVCLLIRLINLKIGVGNKCGVSLNLLDIVKYQYECTSPTQLSLLHKCNNLRRRCFVRSIHAIHQIKSALAAIWA